MNRSDLPCHKPVADVDRRDAWEELLLRSSLRLSAAPDAGDDQRWHRLSSRVAAYEQMCTVNETMALRAAQFRRVLALSRPWPSLLQLIS